MRLDRFLTHTQTATRSQAAAAAKKGLIVVNGVICKDASIQIDLENDVIEFNGEMVKYSEFCWIMMNKPRGVVSASSDKRDKTVVDLLPEPLNKKGLFPCGRLDKDTVGLILLTDDGALSHKLLSPKYHAKKVYEFTLSVPYDKTVPLETGILMDGKMTKSAQISMRDELNGIITLTEGKYHQIKRMFERAGSEVVYLKRLSFGGVTLDPNLTEGEWRRLTHDEEKILREQK